MNKSKSKSILEEREKLKRSAAKITEKLSLEAGESYEPVYTNRHDVPPPEPKDKSKYNPNNYVDIETFITHPYFLNLTPYPWQILTLKLFYAGSTGNSIIKFNDTKKEEVEGCDSCVWKYVVDNEKECAEKNSKNEPSLTILNPLNSRCLTCLRCPAKVREARLNYEIAAAGDKTVESMLTDIKNTAAEDKFQSEYDLIEDIPDEAVKKQIIDKLRNKFQELVLIIGRRGTKSFMTYTIALYEVYKLLALEHPQKDLRLPPEQDIYILNVAKNEDQAKDSIFTPMKNTALSSPFFQQFIGHTDNVLELSFLTTHDIKENERRAAKGISLLSGTIKLKSGSSSASGLVGKTCWCIILDELAAMTGDNPNSGLDKKLYDDLRPSLTTFGSDGKIICLSNPKGPFGKLFELYNTTLDFADTLVVKLPTWLINANVDRRWLAGEQLRDPIEYNMQYGAEFGNNSADPYLTSDDVNYAFNNCSTVSRCEIREHGVEYYCHVDPANRSDYYTIVVVHGCPTGKKDAYNKPILKYFVDHIHFWAPVQMKQPVDVGVVEAYLIDLNSRFRFKQISFDQWHSSETIERLQQIGVPAVLRVFNREYKDAIYIDLLDAFRDNRVEFYQMSSGKVKNKAGDLVPINEIAEAKMQLTFLQKKWKNGKQYIEALSGYKDDIPDALAAAIHECSRYSVAFKKAPKTRIAYTGGRFR